MSYPPSLPCSEKQFTCLLQILTTSNDDEGANDENIFLGHINSGTCLQARLPLPFPVWGDSLGLVLQLNTLYLSLCNTDDSRGATWVTQSLARGISTSLQSLLPAQIPVWMEITWLSQGEEEVLLLCLDGVLCFRKLQPDSWEKGHTTHVSNGAPCRKEQPEAIWSCYQLPSIKRKLAQCLCRSGKNGLFVFLLSWPHGQPKRLG